MSMKMALVTGNATEEFNRGASSPRPKARENTRHIVCKNIGLYGHCRWEEKGCSYSHPAPQSELPKMQLNVDSPSFVPSSLAVNGSNPLPKPSGLSPKSASAAPFKPRGSTPAPTAPIFTPAAKKYNPTAPDWVAPEIPDYFPHAYAGGNNQDGFEPYPTPTPSLPSGSHTPQPPVNPYTQETGAMGIPAYYAGSSGYSQPLQHHLYADLGPHRDHLQANQRTPRDFFLPEDLRQTLQRKTEATLTTFPNSTLPPNIAHYHTLLPLVHNSHKNTAMFGYSSWVYKAMSSQDGKPYCLRRLQGYHVSDESTEIAIRSVAENWSRVRNANVVTVFLAFTNSSFGDSSLIFVTDYHPLSETLAQKHFTSASRFQYRNPEKLVSEQTLWSYIVQLSNALKAIHSAGLAARVIDPSKVLLTDGNRTRLNACAIHDVVKHNTEHTIDDLQRLDLYQFGQLILAVGTNNLPASQSYAKALDLFNRTYSPRLRDRVSWLLNHQHATTTEGIDIFLASIATEMVAVFDASLHLDDQLQTNLARELENSRITRLLIKLNFLNERPEYENDRAWSEQGNRYILQLFRDYVFHQVDSQGKPVLDLAHVLACLNKVDVGIEEKISLTARDENTVIIVTYREVRTAIEAAFGDLTRRSM